MAVYTEVSDEELAAFLAGYDIGELLSYKGIAEGVENTNYFLHTDAGLLHPDALREAGRREADLPFFLGLMEHLAQPRPAPARCRCRRRDGAALGRLAGRPAAIVTFLDGICGPAPDAPQHCAAARRGAGAAAPGRRGISPWRGRTRLSLDGWRPLFERAEAQADSVAAGPRRAHRGSELALPRARLAGRTCPTGVIHADLFTDNVFFMRRRRSRG